MTDMSNPPTLPRDLSASTQDTVTRMTEMLSAQANSLDALFTSLIGHTEQNITQWPLAAATYARLAFQAQWNCRASFEAMAKADHRLAVARREEDK